MLAELLSIIDRVVNGHLNKFGLTKLFDKAKPFLRQRVSEYYRTNILRRHFLNRTHLIRDGFRKNGQIVVNSGNNLRVFRSWLFT